MKEIKNPFAWYPRESWYWPEGDKKLIQVLEHVADIEYILQFVPRRGVCVQAGAAVGVWPVRFAQFFREVFTFEPQRDNWECLVRNVGGYDNIIMFNAPLANDKEKYSIKNDIIERENWGAGYAIPDANGVQAMSIDDLHLQACDLIQLDIEGFELKALQGAELTIEAYKPVIVLEEKPLNHVLGDHTLARQYLETNFAYKQVGAIHRDVVLVAC